MECNPTRVCELLVGLPEVNVLGVDDGGDGPLRVHVESRVPAVWCRGCGSRAAVKDRPRVELVDLPCFGRPTRLVWHKHRWCCRGCGAGSWTIVDDRIAPRRAAMTDRAGRWCTVQVGRSGRTVAEVARELGCDWHTVNDAVIAYGRALVEDAQRIGDVDALGLDETLFCRRGRRHRQEWCTSIVDVSAGRSAAAPARGSRTDPSNGATRSATPCWICRARIARPSTTRCPTPRKLPIRSMS